MNLRERQKIIVTELFTEFYSNKENLSFEIDTNWFLDRMEDDLKTTFQKISVRKIYEDCGINPLCVLSHVRWTKGVNKKLICRDILVEIGEKLRLSELNDNSMNSSRLIDLPKPLEIQHNGNKEFPLSKKFKVKLRKISLQSIYSKCINVTGLSSWRDVLIELNLNIDEIERKRYKNNIGEVLLNYLNYKDDNSIKLLTSIQQDDLHKKHPVLWKQLYKIVRELSYDLNRYSNFFNGLIVIEYFQEYGILPEKNFFLSKNTEDKFKIYLINQKDIRWNNHTEILQDLVLGMYVRGSSIYGDDNKSNIETRITNKIRHWKGKKSINIYKNMGVRINDLQKMKSILDDKYDRQKIYQKLRELLKKTINTGLNHISREYIEKNENEFMFQS
mgnify:CR=1 FL=1